MFFVSSWLISMLFRAPHRDVKAPWKTGELEAEVQIASVQPLHST